MKTPALAFHDCSKDAPSANGAFFDRLIRWRTGSPLVHVEMVFDGPVGDALCFSSVPRFGVRFTHIDLTKPQWKMVSLGGVDRVRALLAIMRKRYFLDFRRPTTHQSTRV
ncbi:MAG: hypothetical protein KGL39_16990 [Patescibacteria group bacterium]|nr:hypothetical protein [Patescibacteria group bacterium]